MKNIEDNTLSIFAIIGFVAILSSFNNQTHDTVPESHIWELSNTVAGEGGDRTKTYKINKVTGEVFYIVKDKESLVE